MRRLSAHGTDPSSERHEDQEVWQEITCRYYAEDLVAQHQLRARRMCHGSSTDKLRCVRPRDQQISAPDLVTPLRLDIGRKLLVLALGEGAVLNSAHLQHCPVLRTRGEVVALRANTLLDGPDHTPERQRAICIGEFVDLEVKLSCASRLDRSPNHPLQRCQLIDPGRLGVEEICDNALDLWRWKRNWETENDGGVEISHCRANGIHFKVGSRGCALQYIFSETSNEFVLLRPNAEGACPAQPASGFVRRDGSSAKLAATCEYQITWFEPVTCQSLACCFCHRNCWIRNHFTVDDV